MEYSLPLSERLAAAIAHLNACLPSDLLERPLSTWSLPSDRHVPQGYLARPLRDLLNLNYDGLYRTPSLGNLRIEKLIAVIERVGRIPDPDAVPKSNSERRFLDVRSRIAQTTADPAILDRPFSNWVVPTDSHLPQAYLRRPISEILASPFQRLEQAPGVGARRIEKVLDVLERCCAELTDDPASARIQPSASDDGGLPAADFARGEISPAVWKGWCDLIRIHRLECEPLGRCAGSLLELPYGIWSTPLGEYAGLNLYELRDKAGHGPSRIDCVYGVFARVAAGLSACPPDSPLSVRFQLPAVRDAALWAEGILRNGAIPSLRAIRDEFLGPMLAQLESDLGPEAVAMTGRRLGLDGPEETLDQIARSAGLTRERIRQIVAKTARVLEVRWPEGRHLMDGVLTFLRAAPDGAEQHRFLHPILETFFEIEDRGGDSRSDVLEAWDRAGRAKRTPMDAAEVRAWAAGEFPDLAPGSVLRWLEAEGLRHTVEEGESLFFSDDPFDRFLLHLRTHPDPIPAGRLSDFLEGDERNARLRLDRDPRFIEDDSKHFLPAERCSFHRRRDRWSLRLVPLPTGSAEAAPVWIAVSDLIHLVVGGMVQAGIGDATVWGVHRFARSLLERVFGSTFDSPVTPFVLAGAFAVHSEGLVRHMRRRRLRWDCADGSVAVRGKRGWVDHVAARARVPMTFDEFDAALREHYQDYEAYALRQLHLADDEDGGSDFGFRYIPGVANVVPGILIPRGWEFDPESNNVSDGVLLVAANLAAMSARSPGPQAHLDRIPWMLSLCEAAASGTMRWAELPAVGDAEVSGGSG